MYWALRNHNGDHGVNFFVFYSFFNISKKEQIHFCKLLEKPYTTILLSRIFCRQDQPTITLKYNPNKFNKKFFLTLLNRHKGGIILTNY